MILVMQAMLFSFNSSLFLCLSRSPLFVLLRDHYIVILLSSWDSSICIAILFSVKQKGKKKRPQAQPKLRPLSPQALVSKMAQVAKQLYIFSSLLNSRSSKSRNLKLLLQINALCNFVCNSLSKLNSVLHYLVKNMLGYSTKCCYFRTSKF